ncbi:DNA-binding protein SMUBP-2 isoform X2 [Nematostella vectensis]|uniref:DNA-binding protein SMUBP-2 isoform X2 n=1 Tax=Nematostella vectensis TaxID=45351 RepID=UPI0020775A4F|nr:DNA-binding protein SMUBP-2 isoform X2 [Nematostella vectensis]
MKVKHVILQGTKKYGMKVKHVILQATKKCGMKVKHVILQATKKCGMKVLACAPSNIAVDNLVEKLARSKAKVVRLGHPARLLKDIQQHSLDAILSSSSSTAIVQDVRRDIDLTMKKSCKSKPAERRQLRQEIKVLRKELRDREEKAMREILTGVEVVLATNTSAGDTGPLGLLKEDHFDLVVIDEAAQALEASCWIPLLRAPRCILAGDHHQLPPTIISPKAAKDGLEVTLMERVVHQLGEKVVHMLTTQYRMHEAIMKWSSDQLYNGRLDAHVSVATHLLCDLPNIRNTDETRLPLLMIDTAGCDVLEMEVEDELSKGNEGEADIVTAHVTALIDAGLNPRDIAVIAPYNLQVELLRQRLSPSHPAVEVKSVDGFQGREKEAVILSLVRSNSRGEVGFLAEDRRINVAITRARRHLAIICDSETVSHHPFLRSLVDYMSEKGEVRSAVDYLTDHVTADAESLQTDPSILLRGGDVFSLPVTRVKDEAVLLETSKSARCKRNPLSKAQSPALQPQTAVQHDSGLSHDASVHLCNAGRYSAIDKVTGVDLGRPRVDDDRKAEKRAALQERVQTFMTDSKRNVLEFPASFSDQQRFMVHSIAEDFGLEHESRGEGKERYITIRKPAKNTPTTQEPPHNDNDMLRTCPLCKKLIPTTNLSLHTLHCEQKQRACAQDGQPQVCAETSRLKESKETRRKPKKKAANSGGENEEGFEALLATFSKLDTRCAFESCKQNISLLGQKCVCCTRVFCLSHHIPEVHGCGKDAKIRARHQLAHAPPRKPQRADMTRKAHLQRKLDTKLDEMASGRKSKKKESKK